MRISDKELREWQSYNRAVHECPDRMAEEIFRLRHYRSELARELLAARAVIDAWHRENQHRSRTGEVGALARDYLARYPK